MARKIFDSERTFQVFDYLISHGHLLIRSQARGAEKKNIDIIFIGVGYMQMSTGFEQLTIYHCEEVEDQVNTKHVVGLLKYPGYKLFKIVSNGYDNYIVAAYVGVLENELPPMKSSLMIDESLRGTEIASSIRKPLWRLFGGS